MYAAFYCFLGKKDIRALMYFSPHALLLKDNPAGCCLSAKLFEKKAHGHPAVVFDIGRYAYSPRHEGLVSATTCFSGQLCIRLSPPIRIGLVNAKTKRRDISRTNVPAAQFLVQF